MNGDATFHPLSWPRLAPGTSEIGARIMRRQSEGSQPALRLVGGDEAPASPAESALKAPPAKTTPLRPTPAAAALLERRRAVERENRVSSRLDPDDARGILATRVAEALEGGSAAILRPERRRRIVEVATRLGLRPFDANLIIAIVQDGARRGGGPRDPELHGMLRLIDTPKPRRTSIGFRPQRGGGQRSESERPTVGRWILMVRAIAAALLAVLWAGAMVAWVIGLF